MNEKNVTLSDGVKDAISSQMKQVRLLDDRVPDSVKVIVRYAEMLVTLDVSLDGLGAERSNHERN